MVSKFHRLLISSVITLAVFAGLLYFGTTQNISIDPDSLTAQVTGGSMYHPADTAPDWNISSVEVAAYANCYRAGCIASNTPASYVSNALYLYRMGGVYHYVSTSTCPNCWANGAVSANPLAPSAPTNLTFAAESCDSVQLNWNAPTNVGTGISKYNIYMDGNIIASSIRTVNTLNSTFSPDYTYSLAVTAVDTSGSESVQSNPINYTARCSILQPQIKIAALMVNFPDWADQPYGASYVNDRIFNLATTSAAAYFKEASYNQVSITGTTYGWITMPKNMTDYCSLLKNQPGYSKPLGYQCNVAALQTDIVKVASSTVDFSKYNKIILLMRGVGTQGLASGIYEFMPSEFSMTALIHELSHGLGLNPHAGDWDCGLYNSVGPNIYTDISQGGCFANRYGDQYDSVGVSMHHWSSYHKQLAGILTSSSVQVASTSGEYMIDQLELPSTGIKQLRIPLAQKGYFYFLEYRRPVGFDASVDPYINERAIDGVLVRLRIGNPRPSNIGDTDTLLINGVFNPGTPFYDPYRNIRVEILDKNASQVRVRVTLPN